MKKIIFVIILFISQNVFAQSGWQWVNPLPQGNDLLNVKFINSKTGYAIGAKGTVIKTFDGGVHWSLTKSCGGNLRVEYLSVVDSSTLYVSGAYYYTTDNPHYLLKSTNGGNDWQVCNNNSPASRMYFVNSTTGFSFSGGGAILKSTNSGVNWTVLRNGVANLNGGEMFFLNEQTFFATLSGINPYQKIIIKTSNQGLDWVNAYYVTNEPGELKGLSFVNSLTGYVYCDAIKNSIVKTTNGGESWFTTHTIQIDNYWNQMIFTKDGTGFIGRSELYGNYSIFKTTNDGVSWNPTNLRAIQLFMSFPSVDTGYAVGFAGLIYKTINGGDNWICTSTTNPELGQFAKVCFADSQNGFIIGDSGAVFKTENAGLSWSLSNISNRNLETCYFKDGSTGYIGSGFGYTSGGTLFRTTNTGINWDSIQNFSAAITSINFINNTIGFLVTMTGRLYKSTNSGLNWITVPTFNNGSNSAGSLHFINPSTGFFFASLHSTFSNWSIIYKTTDSGNTWNYLYSGALIDELKFVDENIGFLRSGTSIGSTLNGGINWNLFWTGYGNNDYSDIGFLSPNTVYCGRFKTTNLGSTWMQYNIKLDVINSIFFIDQNTGILVGGKGAGIMRTTDGGEVISSVYGISANEIPEKFLLHQNYPNPFNPSTRINYELKFTNYVSLKVFDLLGKEVAALVNEKQNAGSYAVDFNSAEFNLPSGIYFYTLNAGEFKETKKMVLVK